MANHTVQIANAAPTRNSNLELLRIFCMLLILSHHFIVHGFLTNLENLDTTMTTDRIIATCLNSIHVSINCFLLISGFFGIKFRLRSLLRLFLTMLFFAVGYYLLTIAITDKAFSWQQLNYVSHTFSHGPWWFMIRYVYLFLMAPFINAAIGAMSKRQFFIVLCLMTFACVYMGYSGHSPNNLSGNSTAHFVYLYCIGRYIRLYTNITPQKRWTYLTVAATCMLLLIGASIVNKWYYNFTSPNARLMYHNNPLNLIASVATFLFFASLDFRSRAVNFIASGTLAAYLLQDNSMYISKPYIYGMVRKWWLGEIGSDAWWGLNYDIRWLQFIALVLLFYAAAIVIGTAKDQLFVRPLLRIYDNIEPYFKPLREKTIDWFEKHF